jgi:hypothetical protein
MSASDKIERRRENAQHALWQTNAVLRYMFKNKWINKALNIL